MGLLKKVNDTKSSLTTTLPQNDSAIKRNKKKSRIDEFLIQVKSLEKGFVYSEKLFSLLCNFLDIKKGSLLLLEQESGTFIPISNLLIDITTVRHLRIGNSVFQKEFEYFNEIINKSDKKIRLFKQFFSIREFSALNSIMIVPFYNNNRLSALLLIIDPSTSIIDLSKELSLSSEKFIIKLIKSREPFNISSEKNYTINNPEPEIALQKYIEKNKYADNSILVILFNFVELENSIHKLLSNSDPYEISNDIVEAISKLISPSGLLIKISTKNYLLFYSIKKGKSPDIILYQINLAISSFFNVSDNLPPIDAKIKTISVTGNESTESLLHGFI